MTQETAMSTIERRTGIIPSEARRASSVVVFIYLQWRSRAENKETSGVPGGILRRALGSVAMHRTTDVD